MADSCDENSSCKDGDDNAKTSDESCLIESVREGNISEIRRLASLWQIKIDFLDKNGMTALMHASYKGATEAVEALIMHGADANKKSTEHEYTPLMFATLAGSKETARLLLEAGADPSAENKIRKTATQMGAFVGRHECVSLINNYIAKQDIEYYTKPQGLETEAKLASFLAEPLQKLIIIANLHPVHVCIFLQENISLIENSQSVARILVLKCEKLFKNEINEIMAMKVHYFSCIHKRCTEWHAKEGISGLIKMLVKGRPQDGFPIAMEEFIRESIRSFPYRESNLLTQLVKTIAPVTKGNDPTALSALTQAINGFQSANFADACIACGEKEAAKKCSACKMVKYCSQPCQKLHWFTHKKNCKTLAEQFEKAALIEKELVENEHAKEASIREKEAPHEEEASADEKEVPHQEVDVNDKEEKEDGIALESGQLTDDKMCENIVESIGNNVKQE